MLFRWLLVATLIGTLAMACGGDDDDGESSTGGAAGSSGSGGSTGGSGGSTGGSGGSTGGSAGSASGGSAGSASGGSAGATSCADYGQGDACKTCLKGSCCKEMNDCKSDANCDGMVTCARLCTNPTDTTSQCVIDCATQWSATTSNYNAIILCMGGNCGTECGYL